VAVNELIFGSKVVFANGNAITLPVSSSDPGTATIGDIYYNSTTDIIRFYNGSAWINIDSAGSSANVYLSNLSSPTAINQDLLPDTTNIRNIGSQTSQYSYLFSKRVVSAASSLDIKTQSLDSLPDSQGRQIGILTDSSGLASDVNGGYIQISTQNILSGSGNSGDIRLYTGSIGGTGIRGSVALDANSILVKSMAPLRFSDSSGVKYVGFKAPTTVTTSLDWVLPTGDGSSGQFLQTDGLGVLSWGTPATHDPVTIGTANGLSLSGQQLSLAAAGVLTAGAVTNSTQTLAGSKTFVDVLNADGGIDRSTSGTLTIGATNSSIINIGSASATVNILGTVVTENATTLNVTNPVINVNTGGAAGSGQNSGVVVEEATIITGYATTSSDRNSWIFKAPSTAGIATITPGVSGITINQSSHDPVTIGTANGLSLSGQQISLAAASASITGALSSTDWNTFNNKQSALTFGNISSLDITITGGVGAIIGSGVSLALNTVGIGKGGTGATTQQGAINALAGAVTSGQYLRGDGTNVTMSSIQASDVPTLNQNTTGSAGSVSGTNVVTNTNLSQMAANTIKGNNTASTANAADLTAAQVTAMLNTFTSSLQGVVPASGGGSTSFLRADGTWATPSGTGVTAVSVVSVNGFAGTSSGGSTPALTLSTTITGLLKGNGTAISAATAGTDYVIPSGSITGTASNITATSNSTLTTLSALSLPGSQVTGNISGNATNVTGTVAIGNGGTGVTSVTTTPTATAFAGWDTNKNLSANNHIQGYTTTATAAGTTTLTVGSTKYQYFTGATTQTVVLPVVTTLVNGQQFVIVNLSTGVVTVNTSGANTVQAMAANTHLTVTVTNTAGGTGTASWSWSYVPAQSAALPVTMGGTGQSTALTQWGVIYASATTTMASTAAGTAGYLLTSNATSAPTYQQINLGTSAGLTGTLTAAKGGTGVTAVTTAPTATAFAGWDANKNLSANNHIEGYTTTATAAGTTTLTVASTYMQYFTGTTTQTVVLPVATTLVNGFGFQIVNNSSGVVTVQTSGANVVQAMAANTVLNITLINTAGGTGTASWSWQYVPLTSGSVTSVGLSLPSIFTVSGSPVTTTGTLTGTLASQTANTFFAAPNGSAGTPTFRAIVAADIPTLNQNTTGTAANVTGTSNSTLTTLSALSLPGSQVSGNISGNAANVTGTVAITNGGTGQTTQQTAINALAGAVTSGQYLRGNGTNVIMSAIQATDVPTLNQNTTGTAANITATSNSTLTTLSALSLPGSQVTGNISGSAGSVSGTNIVSNSNLSQMGANTIKGNNTGATANAADLTTAQVTAMLNQFTSTLQGVVPSSGGGTSNFLRADGTWATPSGTGVTSVSVASANGFAGTSSGGSTPSLTLSTTITGLLKGNGTAVSAATAGTDYVIPSGSITGTAANITATSNSTLTTLSALSLPGSQISGNISGNAANVTGTVAIANGGTGQTTQQAAINTLAGAVTAGYYLRGDGTNAIMSAIQASDIPTLNQNTTGTAANITAISNSTLTTLSALSLSGSQVSGNISGSAGSVSGTNVVSNSNLSQMGANTIKGNNTGATANAADLTTAQVTAMLNQFSSTLQGVVPSSGGGTANFLRADGTWAAPSGTGISTVSVASANGFAGTSSGGVNPSLTLSTTITGLLKGNGTAISSATAGTDYVIPSGNITGTASNITATSNSTLITLSALSLPGSQVSGNISGNAANVTGTIAITNGGTGQTTQQAAINALAGAVTSGTYLRGDGTNVSMSAIQAADVPTLNQNTTGSAGSISGTNVITNSNLSQMSANTIKGNNTGATANAADLTTAQVTAMLNQFTSSLQGVVPSSGGGTTNFLRADGTWAAPPSGVTLTANRVVVSSSSGTLADNTSSDTALISNTLQRGKTTSGLIVEEYIDTTSLTDNSGPTSVTALQFAHGTYAGQEISYIIKTGTATPDIRIGTLYIVSNGTSTSIVDTFTETADCGVSWTVSISGSNTLLNYTATNQGFNRTLRADRKLFRV
jgi:hypothetical protein